MLNEHINPRVKNKFGDTSASDKYREIMFSTSLYKLMDYSILPIMERKFSLSKCPFGYRANTSFSLVALVLKEVLHKYV